MDHVNTAFDQPAGKADLVIVHAIPPVGSPVDRHDDDITALPHGLHPAMTSSAAAPDRPGSKSTSGRVMVAAQSGGIPLEAAPHAEITARPPPGTGTGTGCRAPVASRPAPAAASPAPVRASRVSRSPVRPKSSTWLLASAHASGRATVTAGQVFRAHPVVHRLARRELSAPGDAGFQVDHPGIRRHAVEYVQRIPPGPGETSRPRDRPIGTLGQADVGPRITGITFPQLVPRR